MSVCVSYFSIWIRCARISYLCIARPFHSLSLCVCLCVCSLAYVQCVLSAYVCFYFDNIYITILCMHWICIRVAVYVLVHPCLQLTFSCDIVCVIAKRRNRRRRRKKNKSEKKCNIQYYLYDAFFEGFWMWISKIMQKFCDHLKIIEVLHNGLIFISFSFSCVSKKNTIHNLFL